MAEFGLIGLGVMGKSLARNLASNGVELALYNRHLDGVEEDVAQDFIKAFSEFGAAKGFDDLTKFVRAQPAPRKIFLMVQAGQVTDAVIKELTPLLESGDIIIDGGNSLYKDTERRSQELAGKNIHFIGTGVSGGEEGALKGPSIMPGGDEKAYGLVKQYLNTIAAKDGSGQPCCSHVGSGGAGHFVKMVHNGIEYAEMQLLAEVYDILRWHRRMEPDAIASVLEQWSKGQANSYLLEITIDILRKKEGDEFLIDKILDQAGNKGTGGWSTTAAAELGVPATMIAAALFARYSSSYRKERLEAAPLYNTNKNPVRESINLNDLLSAYKLARIINHHQGFHLISKASEEYNWNINYSEIARIWTNGCIIRSKLMEELVPILRDTNRILLHPRMSQLIDQEQHALTVICETALRGKTASQCFQAANQYLLAYSTHTSSAKIIQAQRDYFGAHTYQRIEDPEGPAHHTNWKDQ